MSDLIRKETILQNFDVNSYDMLIGTFLVPMLVGFLTAPSTPMWLQSLLAVVFSVVSSAIRIYFTVGFTGDNWANAAVTVALAAGASYYTIMRGVAKKLEETGPQLGATVS